MTESLDTILFAAVERWWQANREPLLSRGVTATLQGPLEAPGMDPVYILHLDSERREAEALLFRGGILLISGFDKRSMAEIESSSVDAAAEDDITTALASFA